MPCTLNAKVRNLGMSRAFIRQTVGTTLRRLAAADAQVSINYIGDRKMQTLNRHYRGNNHPTDVLAFAALEDSVFSHPRFTTKNSLSADWGDIFICVPQIRRQAKRFGVSYKEESCRMLIHGLLHLAGFDHVKPAGARAMFALQESILADILTRHRP